MSSIRVELPNEKYLRTPYVRAHLISLDINIQVGYEEWGYERYEYLEGPASAPSYLDILEDISALGAALEGTALVNLRFCADVIHPSDAFIHTVGRACPRLQHIELAYGIDHMPYAQQLYRPTVNGPDPLDALSQVVSATLGMGDFHLYWEMRLDDAFKDDCFLRDQAPNLIKWLRGELSDDSSGAEDNKLVYLKTSASFLYWYRCLVPAWARFQQILDMIDDDNIAIQDSFADGEASNSDIHYPTETDDRYEKQMVWVRAAAALRPSLDRLAQKIPDRELQETDVLDMIWTEPVFAPWRERWFRTALDEEEHATPDELALARDILHHWRKSAASRLAAPNPPAKWLAGWHEEQEEEI